MLNPEHVDNFLLLDNKDVARKDDQGLSPSKCLLVFLEDFFQVNQSGTCQMFL